MLKETPEGFMCCRAQHVSVTKRVLIWRSPRANLNVNKCFSCILYGVRSRNSQRQRKDGKEKREGDRLRKNGEGKRGRACMCPCARSLVQKRHCHYQSEQGCNKAARTWVSCAPCHLQKHHPHCLGNQNTTLMSKTHPTMLSCEPKCSSVTRQPMNEYKYPTFTQKKKKSCHWDSTLSNSTPLYHIYL